MLHTTVKDGIPSEEELEELSVKIAEAWTPLGRRLKFHEAKLTAFHKENEEYSEKSYKMLLHWREREGPAATYQVLYDALCHKLVNKRLLADEFCCNWKMFVITQTTAGQIRRMQFETPSFIKMPITSLRSDGVHVYRFVRQYVKWLTFTGQGK